MSTSYTLSESTSFTVTHARHLGAKVKTDLMRLQRFYDHPSDASIDRYETEIVELLRHGYLDTVTYGFKRDGQWIEPTLRYTAQEFAAGGVDDDPGKVRPGASVVGADFYSYLVYSAKWHGLTPQQRDAFKQSLPFQRGGAEEPSSAGYFVSDRTYSSGGRALGRSSMRSYA
ncbi:MAG: hypothetical protein LCI02_04760 [Proteobacteria bacterium]|nr:hypothetical protein [Pseudomonadota bacterium]